MTLTRGTRLTFETDYSKGHLLFNKIESKVTFPSEHNNLLGHSRTTVHAHTADIVEGVSAKITRFGLKDYLADAGSKKAAVWW